MPAKSLNRSKKEDANQAAIRELYGSNDSAFKKTTGAPGTKKGDDLRSEFSKGERNDAGKSRIEKGK